MRKIAPILILTAGLIAAACGGSSPTETSTPAFQPAAAEATATPTLAPTPAIDSTSSTGGTFRRLWADPPTLDPHLTGDTTSAGLVVEIFSGLVAFDTDLNLVPDIAESWDISPDGMVYTFRLRESAKFHDGSPVTAHDFKWSFERAVRPETESPLADTYLGDIVGIKDVLDGKSDEIRGIKVIDEYTLQITIDAPKAYFLAKLTYPTSYVLDQKNLEEGGRRWTDSPNGTGPFKLAEYKIGERIILERNEFYYLGVAKLDRVINNLAGGFSMAMYENDEIDFTGVGLFDLDRILDPNEPLNRDLITAPPGFNVWYIGFNTSIPPFDDVKFRQALNYAVDKKLIARELYSDLLVPAYGILPPGFPAYNPNLVGLQFDPQKAQQLLAESKYADPESRPRIIVTHPGTGGAPPLDLEVTIQMWKDVLGIDVEVQNVEWATYLQDLNRQRLQVFAGIGWEADYPDPQDFLDVLLHSESTLNHGAYSNPEADAILEEGRVEQDVVKRVKLYQQAEELIVQDAPWLPLWFGGERYALVKPYLKGYKLTPMIVPKLKDVYIEQ